ncbi:uncharacterized protein CLUP02_18357 [Colletotrichum lupini]|uniref:Uncharacterized protein n=1 Tax=Colletotrichum lupini TaxID=145971 RepID=A0A9Q8SGA3_9PEZI|nr:uncharacterized protein CLUP02_18357 [Colletotrichum lupini]UQC76842.1 hypothetical protein CLUP02_18357 [Colletotrichum lupini]
MPSSVRYLYSVFYLNLRRRAFIYIYIYRRRFPSIYKSGTTARINTSLRIGSARIAIDA